MRKILSLVVALCLLLTLAGAAAAGSAAPVRTARADPEKEKNRKTRKVRDHTARHPEAQPGALPYQLCAADGAHGPADPVRGDP